MTGCVESRRAKPIQILRMIEVPWDIPASALRALAQAYNTRSPSTRGEPTPGGAAKACRRSGVPPDLRLQAGYDLRYFREFCRGSPSISRAQRAGGLGELSRDEIHQRRGQAIVGLELQLFQPCPHGAHVVGACARLDDRRNERRELRRRPARLVRALGVNEIESVQRMALVLDPAVHVDAAVLAGIPLDRRLEIHDRELAAVRLDAQVVAPHDGDLREQRAPGFPALGAAAHVIVRALPLDRYLDLVLRAVAIKRPAGEVLRRGFQTAVDRWMYLDTTHDDSSVLLERTPGAQTNRAT